VDGGVVGGRFSTWFSRWQLQKWLGGAQLKIHVKTMGAVELLPIPVSFQYQFPFVFRQPTLTPITLFILFVKHLLVSPSSFAIHAVHPIPPSSVNPYDNQPTQSCMIYRPGSCLRGDSDDCSRHNQSDLLYLYPIRIPHGLEFCIDILNYALVPILHSRSHPDGIRKTLTQKETIDHDSKPWRRSAKPTTQIPVHGGWERFPGHGPSVGKPMQQRTKPRTRSASHTPPFSQSP
jgi:hypothetical protein